MSKPIYLDYAAATPLDRSVLEVMTAHLRTDFYNPSASYLAAKQTRRKIDQARQTIAQLIGSRPAEIIFTSGATESNNATIHGVMRANPDTKLLVSAIEHESILEPAASYQTANIPVSTAGQIDLKWLEKNIGERVSLISVMLVNNELGTIQPLKDIAVMVALERRRRIEVGIKTPLYLHTDAAQAGNWLDLHISRLGVDLMSINGGKIYGPKQSGALYFKSTVNLQPLLMGGGQEFGRRSGTESLSQITGLVKALELASQRRTTDAPEVMALRQLLESKILEIYPTAIINGQKSRRAPHILNITLPGVDNERLMMELDEQGVQVATGSACSASSGEPSHVLKAIGLNPTAAHSSLRFSLGRQTTAAEILKTSAILQKLLAAQQ